MSDLYTMSQKEIADVLGLRHCKKLCLKMEVGLPVIVEAECHVEKDGVLSTLTILKRFEWVEKDKNAPDVPVPPEPSISDAQREFGLDQFKRGFPGAWRDVSNKEDKG